jgi:CheY-like chemotaxis protein
MTSPNPGPKRVLVLDDDVAMAQTAALILNRLGYEAQSETNPAKSIRRILDNEFDLLLTGNRMPGLNGFQVAHLLRTMGSSRNRSGAGCLLLIVAIAVIGYVLLNANH